MIGQPTSRKTQNLLSQIERRMGELNPDERSAVREAAARFGSPGQVNELRKFAMALFARLNARRKAAA